MANIAESPYDIHLIFNSFIDLIAILDENGIIEYINENRYLRVLGYSPEDLVGKDFFDKIHLDDREKAKKIFEDCLKYGESTGEFRIKHKNGYWKWYEIKEKMFEVEPHSFKALVVQRDISERKNLEIELRNLKKELKKE